MLNMSYPALRENKRGVNVFEALFTETAVKRWLEDCRRMFGTSSDHMGLGDIIGFLGPLGITAVVAFLLCLLFSLLSRKGRSRACATLGIVTGIITIGASLVWNFAWLGATNRSLFIASSYSYGFFAAIGASIISLILIVFCAKNASVAANNAMYSDYAPIAAHYQELEQLRGEVESLKQEVRTLRDNVPADEYAYAAAEEAEEAAANIEQPEPRPPRTLKQKIAMAAAGVVFTAGVIAAAILYFIPNGQYEDADAALKRGSYQTAYDGFTNLGDYGDARERAAESKRYLDYEAAMSLYTHGDYQGAFEAFTELGEFSDSHQQARRSLSAQVKSAQEIFPFSNGYARFINEEGLYGFIDTSGYVNVRAEYTDAGDYDAEGFAIVEKDGKFGVIDSSGATTVPCNWDEIYPIQGDTGSWDVVSGGKHGLLDSTGRELLAPEWDGRLTSGDGLVTVRSEGLYGYVDAHGGTVIPPQYDTAEPFSNGFAVVTSGATTAIINKEGERVFEADDVILRFDSENQAVYYLNMRGDDRTAKKYDITNGTTTASWAGDAESRKEMPVIAMGQPSNGRLAVMLYELNADGTRTQTYCYLDSETMTLSSCFPSGGQVWSMAGEFKNRLAIVQVSRKTAMGDIDYSAARTYGVIDASNRTRIGPTYEYIISMNNGQWFKVKRDGKWGVLDTVGHPVAVMGYDSIAELSGGYAVVVTNNRYGYIGSEGLLELECVYEYASDFDAASQHAVVKSNGEWQIIDASGAVIW